MINKMKSVKFILLVFILWRIFICIPLLFGQFLEYREGREFTNILLQPGWTESSFLQSEQVYPLANFDGVHYLNIAFRGYINEVRFFPLYPLLIFLVSFLIGLGKVTFLNTFIAGVILSNLFLLISMYFFYKLLGLDYPEKIAKLALIFLLTFPTAFFFGVIYSESLFLMLLILSFYSARTGRWKEAIIAAFLLSITRIVGVFIIPALILELYLQKVNSPPNLLKLLKENLKIILAIILLVPSGLAYFSFYNFQKWGNFLYFITAHTELGNSRSSTQIILPFQTIYRYIKIFINLPVRYFEWWIAFLEILTFVFILGVFYVSFKKKIRMSYLLFSFCAFMLPVLSGTLTALPRYVLVLFPIYITFALIKSKMVKIAFFIVFCILQITLSLFFFRGYFVS